MRTEIINDSDKAVSTENKRMQLESNIYIQILLLYKSTEETNENNQDEN